MRRPATLTLKSIEEEAADCCAAWADSKVGDVGIHIHHEVVCEPLLDPAEQRIEYILREKTTSEQALRLRLMRPLKTIPHELHEARDEWLKVRAEWNKADAEWGKAYAEWGKAYAEWNKASAERRKASAERNKADAEWRKADAELRNASAEWRKADAEWNKAEAEWRKADAEFRKSCDELGKAHHASSCVPGCPWNGRTIFP